MQRETSDRLSTFARKLLAEWRRLDLPREKNTRAVVAVSGGADSTALLLALEELKRRQLISIELKAAHLDHGLRGRAGAADARWVEELARALDCGFEAARAKVAQRARAARDNLEQAARRERYEFLSRVARAWDACCVVTGHTLDDQAETVLLALLRGSGADGLGGMRAVRPLCDTAQTISDAARLISNPARANFDGARAVSDEEVGTLLARPLLGWARREETKKYCAARSITVREDEMNDDERFARVRLRRKVLPLLETFNPRAVEAIARAAGLLRADSCALEVQASRLMADAADEGATSHAKQGATSGVKQCLVPPLRVEALAGASSSVRRRALRQWLARARGDLRRVELAHVEGVEKLLAGERGGRVAELPGGGRVERRGRWIFFRGKG